MPRRGSVNPKRLPPGGGTTVRLSAEDREFLERWAAERTAKLSVAGVKLGISAGIRAGIKLLREGVSAAVLREAGYEEGVTLAFQERRAQLGRALEGLGTPPAPEKE